MIVVLAIVQLPRSWSLGRNSRMVHSLSVFGISSTGSRGLVLTESIILGIFNLIITRKVVQNSNPSSDEMYCMFINHFYYVSWNLNYLFYIQQGYFFSAGLFLFSRAFSIEQASFYSAGLFLFSRSISFQQRNKRVSKKR